MCLWSAGVLAGASSDLSGKTGASLYLVSHFLADQKMWRPWWGGAARELRKTDPMCVGFFCWFFVFCFLLMFHWSV